MPHLDIVRIPFWSESLRRPAENLRRHVSFFVATVKFDASSGNRRQREDLVEMQS